MVSRFLEPGLSKGVDSLQRQAGGYQQMQTSLNNLRLVVPIEELILRSLTISAGQESANIWVLYILFR